MVVSWTLGGVKMAVCIDLITPTKFYQCNTWSRAPQCIIAALHYTIIYCSIRKHFIISQEKLNKQTRDPTYMFNFKLGRTTKTTTSRYL